MPLFTPDGRYLVVRGRLWRAANPSLRARDQQRLTRALMSARRAVGAALRREDHAAERRARRRVHAAKVALGERGPVWWTDGAPDFNRRRIESTPYAEWWGRIERYREVIVTLLAERGEGKSICPSDVARRAHRTNWRAALGEIRSAARLLALEGTIVVTQRTRTLDPEAEWRGPVRFRLS